MSSGNDSAFALALTSQGKIVLAGNGTFPGNETIPPHRLCFVADHSDRVPVPAYESLGV